MRFWTTDLSYNDFFNRLTPSRHFGLRAVSTPVVHQCKQIQDSSPAYAHGEIGLDMRVCVCQRTPTNPPFLPYKEGGRWFKSSIAHYGKAARSAVPDRRQYTTCTPLRLDTGEFTRVQIRPN